MADSTAKDNKRWSQKMEAEDSLRTLDCLRGRLLAERQASRVAKEEAEVMGNKLIELENKLREEIKLRQKADKKLKFLLNKLESLEISPTMEGLEQSSSSEICGFSCSLSYTSTSGNKDHEDSISKENVQDSTASTLNLSPLPIQESSRTQHTSVVNPDLTLKDSPLHQSAPSCQDSKAYSHRCSNSEALVVENERNGSSKSDNEEDVDNSLALVPVSLAAPTTTDKSSELKLVNKNIHEVLDALRHARESIQSSMERRNRIRVGAT